MIRKALLQIGVPALLAFIAWNAYLAVNHLQRVQKTAALTLESSAIQAKLSGVLKDLTDMETGQRGYSANQGPRVPAALLRCEGQDRNGFCRSSSRSLESDSARTIIWSRSWSPWPNRNRLRWSILLVCANKGIAFALSSSSIQTKEKTIWMRFGGSYLRYLQRRAASSRDWTEKRLLH